MIFGLRLEQVPVCEEPEKPGFITQEKWDKATPEQRYQALAKRAEARQRYEKRLRQQKLRDAATRARSKLYLDKVLAKLDEKYATTEGPEHTLVGQCKMIVESVKGRSSVETSLPRDAQNLLSSRWYGDYVMTGFFTKEETKDCFVYIRKIVAEAFEGA